MVSPDAGGVERARFFAKKMDAALAIVDKRRVEMNVAEVMHVIGDVEGRTCLIIDDLIDTAGTLVKIAQALLENGAKQVYACARMRCCRGRRWRICRIGDQRSGRDQHDSAERSGAKRPKIKVLSIAGLIGRAIQAIHEETSVSSYLFRTDSRKHCRATRVSVVRTTSDERPTTILTRTETNYGDCNGNQHTGSAKREPGNKNDARRVRVSGKIPAVVYGAGKDAASIAVDPRQVRRILNSETGHNTIFDLALGGEHGKAMIVDWQYEPIKGVCCTSI